MGLQTLEVIMRKPVENTLVPVLCAAAVQDNGDGTWTATVHMGESLVTKTRRSRDEALEAAAGSLDTKESAG